MRHRVRFTHTEPCQDTKLINIFSFVWAVIQFPSFPSKHQKHLKNLKLGSSSNVDLMIISDFFFGVRYNILFPYYLRATTVDRNLHLIPSHGLSVSRMQQSSGRIYCDSDKAILFTPLIS